MKPILKQGKNTEQFIQKNTFIGTDNRHTRPIPDMQPLHLHLQ